MVKNVVQFHNSSKDFISQYTFVDAVCFAQFSTNAVLLLCETLIQGQGANQALLDALLLARSLFRTSTSMGDPDFDISVALEEYEKEMLNRSGPKVKASAEAARFLHTEVAITKGNVTRGAAAADLNDSA